MSTTAAFLDYRIDVNRVINHILGNFMREGVPVTRQILFTKLARVVLDVVNDVANVRMAVTKIVNLPFQHMVGQRVPIIVGNRGYNREKEVMISTLNNRSSRFRDCRFFVFIRFEPIKKLGFWSISHKTTYFYARRINQDKSWEGLDVIMITPLSSLATCLVQSAGKVKFDKDEILGSKLLEWTLREYLMLHLDAVR